LQSSRRYSKSSPQRQLSQEEHLNISHSTLDKNKLLRPTLGTNAFDDDDADDGQLRREANNVTTAMTAKGDSNNYLSSKGN
jgi:hypothetical protein